MAVAFHPDGKSIIFQAEAKESGNPFYQIYTQKLEGGRATRVSPGVQGAHLARQSERLRRPEWQGDRGRRDEGPEEIESPDEVAFVEHFEGGMGIPGGNSEECGGYP